MKKGQSPCGDCPRGQKSPPAVAGGLSFSDAKVTDYSSSAFFKVSKCFW